ncbi:MAG TPA: caspase family protein [Acidimicrobiales bacterium]|nr:caspase family protein [Acidimicrobiales bacterium]
MGRLTKTAAAVLAITGGSIVASVTAHAAPAPDAPKRALLIGVSAYQPPTVPTVGSANDARELHKVLLKNGWPESGIRTLVDGEATAANIRAGMDWLVAGSGPGSFSIFHYSGHTKQSASGLADGDAEEWDEYLWGVDNKLISDGEFAGRMRALQGLAWINVSNCEAAGFDDGVSSPTRLFTAASREDQKGYERYDTRRSIFTGLLTEAFLQKPNGTVSIQEAFAYAAEAAPRQSAAGEYGPQNPHMAGGDATLWYLSSPVAAASARPAAPSLIPAGLLPPELLRLVPPGLLPGILPPIAPSK